jgi:hypothetical protein
MPDIETNQPPIQAPSVDQLQFQHAEALPGGTALQGCVACKKPIVGTYFLAGGRVVCPICADRIQLGTQAPPASLLGRAALYGAGAAIAGCAIYAAVAIVTGLEVGLIAILVGVMVGKAVRKGSGGLGGRPQQILAVALTYFAITTSYVPVFIHHALTHPKSAAHADAARDVKAFSRPASSAVPNSTVKRSTPPFASITPAQVGAAAAMLIALCAAAPFLSLAHGSGFLTILIIFFGLSQAWKLTGRAKIRLIGPYQLTVG